MQEIRHRSQLGLLKRAIERKQLTIGFIGGSITDARPRHNWPEPVIAWFAECYPDVRLFVENAAIGATGSELGVFRTERDLIRRGCDLVFVEFAVNDQDMEPDARMRSRKACCASCSRTGSGTLC
ncbi:hypothetical protein N6H14_21095 [Paenibacillus sp. CC-CFT747]|nr:hypothetical protein N6H14_21095 [Paenibacillus sp. CC-CFT747]